MNPNLQHAGSFQPRTGVEAITALWRRLASHVRRIVEAHQQRRELAALSDHQLRDLGLLRGEVDRVVEAPFWEPVDHAALESSRRQRRRVPYY